MGTRTHWKNVGNYDYLGAYSLDGIAEEITITISSVSRQRVTANGGKSEDCVVAFFEETEVDGVTVKPMVLNATNCKIVEKMYGPYVEDWSGKKITVWATTTTMGRDKVPCLRIKNKDDSEPSKPKKEAPVEQVEHTCEVCGKPIDNRTYNAVIKAYNASVCSKECYNKYLENNKEENN